MIFSRGRGGGRHARKERSPGDIQDVPATDESQIPSRGPYDVSEDPPDAPRLDLGSLRIPAVPEVEVRVQANPEGEIQQVVLVHGENALQLGVFAAPRSDGIWDEVREEIRASLFADGVAADEVEGDYGIELRARVRTPDGLTDLRFVGIDGPRWMVRGVYQGHAATDPTAAGPLAECLDGVVVDRGQEARPVREPLPLRLPREADEAAGDDQAPPGLTRVGPGGSGPTGAPAAPRINGAVTGHHTPNRADPPPRRRDTA